MSDEDHDVDVESDVSFLVMKILVVIICAIQVNTAMYGMGWLVNGNCVF